MEYDFARGGVDAHYFAALADGRFEIPRCEDCTRSHFYPRAVCPYCGSARLVWVLASGEGTIYSTSTVHPREGDAYNVALVDLSEGPRLMTRIEQIAPEQVRIGSPVRSRIVSEGGDPLLVFVPREASA
ncbi:OB-fold domain-containing protein [Saccharomonospora sp. NPDC046836]|uniref:Zn-ribbon domain-containing OB-fold protein n=1 Tax=Saccharomonospora sp. NPDC046836 TaxID=3156921 RepID=UPI0033DBA88F